MRYRENGDLERMQRFWFTGACEPRKRRRTSSKPLALAQVTHYRNKLYYPYWTPYFFTVHVCFSSVGAGHHLFGLFVTV